MRRTNDPTPSAPRTPAAAVDLLLEDAEVLDHTYDDYDEYDAEATRRRLTARRTDGTAAARPPGPATPPTRFPSAHEQAAHDLSLAVSLVLNAPEAAGALTRLVAHDRIDPEGAVVFAALLHLTGHRDAAQFWWQFAAGGGNRTAAFCLFLAHQQRAEFRDAAHWRDQSRSAAGAGRAATCGRALRAAAGGGRARSAEPVPQRPPPHPAGLAGGGDQPAAGGQRRRGLRRGSAAGRRAAAGAVRPACRLTDGTRAYVPAPSLPHRSAPSLLRRSRMVRGTDVGVDGARRAPSRRAVT